MSADSLAFDSFVLAASTDTLAVESGGRRTVDPGLDELGDYELTVTLEDGTERRRPFDIESYDRRMGSNLIVEIGDDIMVLMEE